jgi:hypothetical protein
VGVVDIQPAVRGLLVREVTMLTIFSMPKAFRGHIGAIQRNALKSWTLLRPRPEIILFGSDDGTAEVAVELGAKHIAEIASNERGAPLLSDMFKRAESAATAQLLCYVNADILLPGEFMEAVQMARAKFANSLLVSGRINIGVTEELDFTAGWEQRLRSRSDAMSGGPTAIDVFVFWKGTYAQVPDFAIGRLWFDQWLIKAALQQKLPVVDASIVAPVLHQNHDYNHVAGGAEQVWRGTEPRENLRLYGSKPHSYTLLDVTHELAADGSVRRVWVRRPATKVKELAWKLLVERTVTARNALGLRRKFWQGSAAGPRG